MTKLDKTALHNASVRTRNICVAVLGWILASTLALRFTICICKSDITVVVFQRGLRRLPRPHHAPDHAAGQAEHGPEQTSLEPGPGLDHPCLQCGLRGTCGLDTVSATSQVSYMYVYK